MLLGMLLPLVLDLGITSYYMYFPVQVGAAQQYNFSLRGYQPLLQWAQRHTADMHAPPPRAAHETLVSNGNNHTLEVGRTGWREGRGVRRGVVENCDFVKNLHS